MSCNIHPLVLRSCKGLIFFPSVNSLLQQFKLKSFSYFIFLKSGIKINGIYLFCFISHSSQQDLNSCCKSIKQWTNCTVKCFVSERVFWEVEMVAFLSFFFFLQYTLLCICTRAVKTEKLALHLEWEMVTLVTSLSWQCKFLINLLKSSGSFSRSKLVCIEWRIVERRKSLAVTFGQQSEVAASESSV